MSEALKSVANINDLFSASIDDIADLPSFEVPVVGSYILAVTAEIKKINDKDVVEAQYTVQELVEPAIAGETAVPGTKFSTIFMIDNEFGIGNLKKFLKPFADHYGNTNVGELIGEIKDVTVAATLKHRKDKNDPDKVYAIISNLSVA